MSDRAKLLDAVAVAKRERDEAAVRLADWCTDWKLTNGPLGRRYSESKLSLAAAERALAEAKENHDDK